MRVELERLVRSVDGDGDGSGGGDGLLQFVLVVLIDIREADVGGADVLLAESEIQGTRNSVITYNKLPVKMNNFFHFFRPKLVFTIA